MSAFLISLLIIAVLLIINNFKRRFQLGLQIPGPWFVPFVGNVQFAAEKPERIFVTVNKLRKKYQRSFRLWLGVKLWIFLHSTEETKQVLSNPMLKRADDFVLLRPLVGDGLLLSEGKKWQARRKALTPAFHPKILEDFIDSFCHHAEIFARNLHVNEKVEVSNKIFLCILDTICETAMGVKINSQVDPGCVYAKAFHDASHLLFQRIVNPVLAIDAVYKWTKSCAKLNQAIRDIHRLTEKVIQDRKQAQVKKSSENVTDESSEIGIKKKLALLDVLLSVQIEGQPLSDEDIKEEVNTFLFAGVDTTKSSMSFIMYNLGKYKKFQTRIIDEIWAIIGKDPEQTFDITHINQLQYLEMFIKESLRYHTTVPLTSRHVPKEMHIGDMLLPEDSTVWINMYGLAHDPELFNDPNEFVPERFDAKDERFNVPQYGYLPFAGGPRICIGKKYSLLIMKVIVIKVLLHYEILLAHPNEELVLISEMVLKSQNGINLIFKRRQ